jgi:o-succinylbenzoate synthase
MNGKDKIKKVSCYLLKLPLRSPYRLAFGEITAFDTILVKIDTGAGQQGMGDATLLAGYTHEEVEGSWLLSREIAQKITGLDFEAAKNEIDKSYPSHPFTVTAFVTALEMIEAHPLLQVPEPADVPVLGLLHGENEREIQASIEHELEQGYRTLKVKVGFDAKSDLDRVGMIQRLLKGRAQIRLDANQGYTPEDGKWFASRLNPESIELFEQPCAAEDWSGACAVARVSGVPMMLDESIFAYDDIARAAECKAAAFIKLKLMKMGGLSRLEKGIRFIREHGMEPVLGNGVASDIGCWMEACVARDLIGNAGEMNGSLKTKISLLENPIPVTDGNIKLMPAYQPKLNVAALSAVKREEIILGA